MAVSDLAAMLAEVDVLRRRAKRWLDEYDLMPCDVPGCIHPLCRDRSVKQREAEGPVHRLAGLSGPPVDLKLTR